MISAVILTKNEEKNIVDCLESIKWVDEIIIIDDNSSDRTIEIVKKTKDPKIRIIQHSLNDDFSNQRNLGLKYARGDWILFVDSDERVSGELKNEITDLTTNRSRLQQLNSYFIKRKDFMWGRELKHGEIGNVKLLRLAKKGKGTWEGMVHERWKINGDVGELKNPLIHYPHQTINECLTEINLYTDIKAKELHRQTVHVYWTLIILYPLGKFFLNYFLRKGFLDGIPGLIIAIIMSFHSFLVRGKLWLLNNKYE